MKTNFSRLMKRIRDTQDEEIDCSACHDQISSYVDVELAGGQAAEQMPRVKQHLDQCGVCMDEYRVLRDMARLETDHLLPSTDELVKRLRH